MPRNPKTATVQARKGIRVPIEGAPRRYITDDQPRTVTLSAYYRRQIKDGDLVVVQAAKPTKKTS